MNAKYYKIIVIIILFLFVGCSKTQKPSVKEFLSDPKHQDETIEYIMNDYPMMAKFLDKCMNNNQAKSMMLGHWSMMEMMMHNSNMMIEIMKSDTTLFNQLADDVTNVAIEDSTFRNQFFSKILKDEMLKNAILKHIQQKKK